MSAAVTKRARTCPSQASKRAAEDLLTQCKFNLQKSCTQLPKLCARLHEMRFMHLSLVSAFPIFSLDGARFAQEVCRYLFDNGPSTLRDVTMGTGAGRRRCCSALVALIQHSYVQPFVREEVASARTLATATVYKARI